MFIIDAHTHVRVNFKGADKTNIYGTSNAGVKDYLQGFTDNGVSAMWTFGSIFFRNSSVARKENKGLSDVAKKYPDRIFPFGTVNPALPEKELLDDIAYVLDDLGLLGLKFVPICQGTSLANPGYDIIAEAAIERRVPIVIHDGSAEYCSAIQVLSYAKRYPKLTVMAGHGGLRELWPEYVEYAGAVKNLYICTSGPTQQGIQALYDRLGPERLIFGSDAGCGPPAIITAYLRRIDRLQAPMAHKEMILGQNARKLLGKP
jgi:uncharacterized protein